MSLTKTIKTELLAITTVAAGAQQLSSVLDLSGNESRCTIFIDHGRDSVTAFTGSGTEYRVEVSQKASGNDGWRTISSVVCDITAPTSIVVTPGEVATTNPIRATTVPALAVGAVIFLKNGTLSLSEWVKVTAVTVNTNFTTQDAITNAVGAATYFTLGEQFVISIDVTSVTRLRVVVNNSQNTVAQNIVSRVACITVI